MPSVNAKQLQSIIKKGIPSRTSLGDGLYLRISAASSKAVTFEVRYTSHGKRRFITLSPEYPDLSLSEAKFKAHEIRLKNKTGDDPLEQKKLLENKPFKILNDVAESWLEECEQRIQYADKYRSVYYTYIAPIIGKLPPEKVRPIDVLQTIKSIKEAGYQTVANDALHHLKHIFRHGMKLGELISNPAEPFSVKDVGGVEKARTRVLSKDEVKALFSAMQQFTDQIVRENYLAVFLLLSLCVRKMELMAAQWSEFDLENGIWELPAERTKTSKNIQIPLSQNVLTAFNELKVRSAGSDYVFPSRRRSKRPHVSPDTLNFALTKLVAEHDLAIGSFTVHDLRRTAKTFLAGLRIPPHISERCLNHKIRGVEGIYDQYDYFEERKEALEKLSNLVKQLENNIE